LISTNIKSNSKVTTIQEQLFIMNVFFLNINNQIYNKHKI